MENNIFQNALLIIWNNFNHDKHRLRIKLKLLKKGSSQKIIEKRQNDGYETTTYVNNRAWYVIEVLSECFSDHT